VFSGVSSGKDHGWGFEMGSFRKTPSVQHGRAEEILSDNRQDVEGLQVTIEMRMAEADIPLQQR